MESSNLQKKHILAHPNRLAPVTKEIFWALVSHTRIMGIHKKKTVFCTAGKNCMRLLFVMVMTNITSVDV